ncbi:hypothetical protein MN116_001363 [Schistosoma mekongi]|uniref:Uncharacterized protein n=1 Tax=Schistosoma mekongi TaxID=38744 RepID=A0AAE1ZL60_SCHME|nr:hypothetical protein MN116_001363 [Schistosoma mekongi]
MLWCPRPQAYCMSDRDDHLTAQNNVNHEPSIPTGFSTNKTSNLDHNLPSTSTMLAYVDFRPWFEGWNQLNVNDQSKLKELVTLNSTQ